MSMNNHLWNEADVLTYCFNRMQELRKEDPVNEVAVKRYTEDLTTASKGTRAFTVSTCEMLKDLIKTKLVPLKEFCDAKLESETPLYVTEAVQVAEIFFNSQDQGGGADVSGKTAETIGKKAERILKKMDEATNMMMREKNIMAREKALLDGESALAEAKALWERESTLDEDGLSRSKFFDERANERAPQFPVLRSEPRSSQGQLRSKIFDERDQFPVLRSGPRSSILVSPPISEHSNVAPPPIPDNDMSDPKKDDAQLAECLIELAIKSGKTFQNPTSCTTSVDNAVRAEIGTLYPAQTSISETVIDTDFPVDVLIGSPTETDGVERPRLLPAFDNGLISETFQDEDGQSRQFPVLSSEPRSSQGQLRSKIFDERDQCPVLRSEPRSSIFVSPPISEHSDVGPPSVTDNDMIDPKKDDTQMAECLNELKSGKTFRNPTSCHTSVDNAVPVEIGTLSLAPTSISEPVIDTDFPVDDDTFYKGARSSMRKDIVIVADSGIRGDVSTSTVPSWRTTQAQQIELSVEPGHPKCWMQSKDSWKSSMLQFRPEVFILPNPAKNPNRFPFERKLLEEYTRRMFAAQQLEPSTSPVASRSHAIAKPVSFKQQDACIDRGKAPFKLDRFRIAVTHMPVTKAVQLMSFMGMSIAQDLQIIGRHLWCRLLQRWTIRQALPCTPDETFPPGRYNYLTTSKSFKATRDQCPLSSSKLLCYWGIELAI